MIFFLLFLKNALTEVLPLLCIKPPFGPSLHQHASTDTWAPITSLPQQR